MKQSEFTRALIRKAKKVANQHNSEGMAYVLKYPEGSVLVVTAKEYFQKYHQDEDNVVLSVDKDGKVEYY